MRRLPTLCGLAGLALAACASEAEPTRRNAVTTVPVLEAVYETARDTVDNIDSPAVWHGPDGQHWLLATAKEGDVIVVSDAATGTRITRVGGTGNGAGQMDRPNGVAIIDDLMWVVERDNRRVQVFSLPAFQPLGSYGQTELVLPYGIAIVRRGAGVYSTYITDNYESGENIPADSLLGRRVRHFRVTVDARSIASTLVNTFGDTNGPGVLRVVESIAADPANDRLLIAEEQEGASMVKAYTLQGRFTGQIIPQQYFPAQAEGIVLYTCGDREGYWVATDQSYSENTFHVFDRVSLEHRGSFRGRTVLNTDGIALTQTAFGGFAAGAFFAVHNDGSVAAFQWRDIAKPLGLRMDCAAS